MQTTLYDPVICDKIINYLHLKVDGEDSLDGLLCGLFPDEIDKISKDILTNLNYLISIGKIQFYRDKAEKGCYRIRSDK
jgi:hypothetical protein